MPDEATEFDLQRFCSRVDALSYTDPAKALWAITRLVLQIISRQSSVGRVFSAPELDILTLKIGERLLSDFVYPSCTENHTVYLLTQVGQYGGHGRVLRDLIQAHQGTRQTLILSHVAPALESEYDIILQMGVDVRVAPNVALDRKVVWIAQQLAAIRPAKTYIMVHQFDAATIAATQPGLGGQYVFLHNCDHSLSLGVHMPHALHADFHRKGFFKCRSERRGQPGYVIPLTADDRGSRCKRPFAVRGHITTCTTGGFEKITNRLFIEPKPYLYQYADMVPAILKATGGTHLHVGQIPEELLARIRKSLADLGIAHDRFQSLPSVDSVWEFFLRKNVDIYIGSAPSGGGRATVEAMGAGLPLIIHSNYRSAFLCVQDEVYREAMIWRDFDQLSAHLATIGEPQLRRQSILSRSYYEDHHTPQKFAQALARIERRLPAAEPEHCSWLGNDLQDFLDICVSDLKNAETEDVAAILALGSRSDPSLSTIGG